jgi:hypothetical protein
VPFRKFDCLQRRGRSRGRSASWNAPPACCTHPLPPEVWKRCGGRTLSVVIGALFHAASALVVEKPEVVGGGIGAAAGWWPGTVLGRRSSICVGAMSQMAFDAAPARSGSTAGGARRRAPLERVGACLVLVSILCGLAALWGYFLGGQQAEWGASIDGSYVSDGSASRALKFDVSNSVLALATVLAMSLINLTFGACSSSSSGSFSRKCAALLLICCILGAELPQAEALTKPVVDGEGLRRTPFDLADGQAAGAANQRSNDSASADVPEDYASSRHLLSLDGVLGDVAAPPSQMPTELLEMSGITDADQSPTPPAEFLKQERDVEKVSDEMSKEMRISKKRQEKMAARVKKLDEMISDQLSNVATSVKEENTKLTNEIVEVPGVPGPKGAPGIDGAPGAPGKNGIRKCQPAFYLLP